VRLSLLVLTVALLATVPAARAEEDAGAAISPELLKRCVSVVERIRGVTFTSDIPARRVTPDAYRKRMLDDMERLLGGAETLRRLELLLRDLGQLKPKETIAGVAQRFFPTSVAASYDADRKRIEVLRGFRSSILLCHELTHALDDQRFDLLAMFRDGELEFDRCLALGALIEGSAESVEMTLRTRGALPLVPISVLLDQGERRIAAYLARHDDIPLLLARAFIFQYFSGLVFAETVKRRRLEGWAALDEVFAKPPRTTEQVLHPAKYFAGETARPLTPWRPQGWTMAAENALGELGASIALEGFGLETRAAERAAAGWGADRIAHLVDADGAGIFVWDTTWDTLVDAREFFTAARTGLRGPLRAGRGGTRLALSVGADGLVDLLVRRDRRVILLRGAPPGQVASLRASMHTALSR
jgi:hypothetical protein